MGLPRALDGNQATPAYPLALLSLAGCPQCPCPAVLSAPHHSLTWTSPISPRDPAAPPDCTAAPCAGKPPLLAALSPSTYSLDGHSLPASWHIEGHTEHLCPLWVRPRLSRNQTPRSCVAAHVWPRAAPSLSEPVHSSDVGRVGLPQMRGSVSFLFPERAASCPRAPSSQDGPGLDTEAPCQFSGSACSRSLPLPSSLRWHWAVPRAWLHAAAATVLCWEEQALGRGLEPQAALQLLSATGKSRRACSSSGLSLPTPNAKSR